MHSVKKGTLPRYNAACAVGVITRRLSDVLPNRLLNSRTECSVTLPLRAEALGRIEKQGVQKRLPPMV